jgi:plastocyanin
VATLNRKGGRLAGALLVAAVLFAGAPDASGHGSAQPVTAIRGRVDVERPASIVPRRPGEPGPPVADAGTRRAVVYFESAPRGAFEERESARATLDQRDETFVPHVLAITVGTVVDFPNNDRTYHNVFSLSKAQRFDLGRYAAGRSKAVRFDRPGIVRVFCDIHSHMNAFILVFNHRFFAVTDPQGRYEISGVPPGTYTLSAWYEGSVRDQRTVTISGESRQGDIDFTIR